MPLSGHNVAVLGISHPCTTFDYWRVLFTVDEQCRVVGAVQAFPLT